jgi:hypothetical protein
MFGLLAFLILLPFQLLLMLARPFNELLRTVRYS